MGKETLGTIIVTMFTIVVVFICIALWNTVHTVLAILATIILGGVALWADIKVARYFIGRHRNKGL